MARRNITLRVTGSLVQGVINTLLELEDDKGNWLPIAVTKTTSNGITFVAEADTGNLVDLGAFEKAVKDYAAAQSAKTEATLAAQNTIPVELVTVTPQGQAAQEPLENLVKPDNGAS